MYSSNHVLLSTWFFKTCYGFLLSKKLFFKRVFECRVTPSSHNSSTAQQPRHAFNNAKGSANERVLYALEVIGPCVFHGFVTLMLATVPLSQSVTYVFRNF